MLYFDELCSKLDIDPIDIGNNDLFTSTELSRWLTIAKDMAVARYPWPFTEGKRDIASVSGQEEYDYPTDVKTDSLRFLTVNGKRYEKLLFEDYLTWKEDYSSSTKKYFSDRNRTIYINYLATDFGNSIIFYGQVEVSGSITSSSTTSVFSPAEPEGDEAIIKLAYASALGSEKMKDPVNSKREKNEAFEILDSIWDFIQSKQHTYQTKDRSMFKRLNVLGGEYEDDINNPLQW